jgi:hypothetical protein
MLCTLRAPPVFTSKSTFKFNQRHYSRAHKQIRINAGQNGTGYLVMIWLLTFFIYIEILHTVFVLDLHLLRVLRTSSFGCFIG